MKNLLLSISFFFISIYAGTSYAQIIHVPGDQPTIQAGINAAQDGDTVLVDDGTYLENISYKGKAITVASNFIIDEDTNHISNTIIDGSQPLNTDSASVVTISECGMGTELCGFTIKGGYGIKTPWNARGGGGIWIMRSSANIRNNHIIQNIITNVSVPDPFGTVLGGGLFFVVDSNYNVSLHIANNIIANNEVGGLHSGGAGMAMELLGTGVVGYLIEYNTIEYNITMNNDIWKAMGGGFYMDFFMPTQGEQIIRNNIIRNNTAQCQHSFGGGMYIVLMDPDTAGVVDNSPGPYIYNNLICNNYSSYLGGAVSVWRNYATWPPSPYAQLTSEGNFVPKPSFINNTIMNNTAADGSGFFIMNHTPFLMNNILWNNHSPNAPWGEVYLGDEPYWLQVAQPNTWGDAEIHHTDIQGGWNSGEGNINFFPAFEDTLYNLSDTSFCIGNGIDSFEINGTSYNSPPTDFNGNPRPNPIDVYIDIGAIESLYYWNPVGVRYNSYELPVKYRLMQNHPNPFNAATAIQYSIPQRSNVLVKVYDILGSEISTVVNEEKEQGVYTINFDANNLASGLYLYRIQAGSFIDTKKMILLK